MVCIQIITMTIINSKIKFNSNLNNNLNNNKILNRNINLLHGLGDNKII